MITNNPIFQIRNFIKQQGNPRQLLINYIYKSGNSNPILSNLIQKAEQGDVKSIENFARNLYSQKGGNLDKDLEEIKRYFNS